MDAPELSPIAYEAFVADVQAVAAALEADAWRPDHIVGIGRGGLVPSAYLSHRTGISLLSVDHSAGVAAFGEELLATLAAATRTGERILLVDDINDSGHTLAALKATLARHGAVADGVRIAVLIDNVRSVTAVDYRARTIDRARDKRWFVFPWEAMATSATLVAEAVPARFA